MYLTGLASVSDPMETAVRVFYSWYATGTLNRNRPESNGFADGEDSVHKEERV